MNFSWRRARSVALKEYKHILRDPFTLLLVALPLYLLYECSIFMMRRA